MMRDHCLPEDFFAMGYDAFLQLLPVLSTHVFFLPAVVVETRECSGTASVFLTLLLQCGHGELPDEPIPAD